MLYRPVRRCSSMCILSLVCALSAFQPDQARADNAIHELFAEEVGDESNFLFFSPDGGSLFFGTTSFRNGIEGSLHFFDAKNENETEVIRMKQAALLNASYTRDGTRIITWTSGPTSYVGREQPLLTSEIGFSDG